jgi:hypothetical protein
MKNDDVVFDIDVLGSCNLRCPSCPIGNSREVTNPTGFMQPELLDSILKKATAECRVTGVALFNWSDPLLHPALPELVRIVRSYDVPCHVSSSLNFVGDLDRLLAANPDSFRISNSGFQQTVYSRTHRGGDIEQVKRNMVALAQAHARACSRTEIHVLFHRYLSNLGDEFLMKEYAKSLGFGFKGVWAYMMPVEKLLAHRGRPATASTITTHDLDVIGNLALPLDEALRVSRQARTTGCALRDSQITLNLRGDVQLCNVVYDSAHYTLAPFLSTPLSEIQRLKYSGRGRQSCEECMQEGLHAYFAPITPELELVALRHVLRRSGRAGLRTVLAAGSALAYSVARAKARTARDLVRSRWA